MANKIVVLGIGNILLSDEGVGVKVVNELKKLVKHSENVELVDGGVAGFSLLPFIEKADKLLVIDAISGNKPPGTIYKFKNDEIPVQTVEKISLHEINFLDVLNLAKLRNKYPEEIVFIGIEPGSLEVGLDFSEPVKQNYEKLLKEVINQLKIWGVEI